MRKKGTKVKRLKIIGIDVWERDKLIFSPCAVNVKNRDRVKAPKNKGKAKKERGRGGGGETRRGRIKSPRAKRVGNGKKSF